MISAWGGLKVVSDINCTVSIPWFLRRTWRERLFSRPWRPLEEVKVIKRTVPSPHIYVVGKQTVIAHPDMVAKLGSIINQEGGQIDLR